MSDVTDLTYLQLRQRIVDQLNRDDLDTQPLSDSSIVHQFVKDRVLHYSRTLFYSSQFTDTTKSTTAGEPFVDLPSGWQSINFLRFLYNGLWLPLGNGKPSSYENILSVDVLNPPLQSVPSQYALYQNPSTGNMAARIYPVPNATYQLEFTMDKPPAAPSSDSEVSFWTTEAQILIIESVCEHICRRKINRPMKADQHAQNVEIEENEITSKTIRISGGLYTKPYYP